MVLLLGIAVAQCGTVAPAGAPPQSSDGGAGGSSPTDGTGGSMAEAGGYSGSAIAQGGTRNGAAGTNGGTAGSLGTGTTTTGTTGTGGSGAGRGGASGNAGAGGSTGLGGDAGAARDAGATVGARCGAPRKLMWSGTFDAGWIPSHWSLGVKFESGKTGLTEIVDDASGQFGKVLRVHYDAGVSDKGGAEFKGPVAGLPADSACFSYWVRFDSSFGWVKGGKLPGLCAGACFSGGNPSDGVTGWSMRYMWRSGGAGEGYGYITPPGQGDFGTQLGLGSFTFTTGKWHHLEEQLVLNTPGRADGVLKVWLDRDSGTAAPNYQSMSLTYRTASNAETRIGLLFFSTFFGGSGADWAPPVATFADFAMFELFE